MNFRLHSKWAAFVIPLTLLCSIRCQTSNAYESDLHSHHSHARYLPELIQSLLAIHIDHPADAAFNTDINEEMHELLAEVFPIASDLQTAIQKNELSPELIKILKSYTLRIQQLVTTERKLNQKLDFLQDLQIKLAMANANGQESLSASLVEHQTHAQKIIHTWTISRTHEQANLIHLIISDLQKEKDHSPEKLKKLLTELLDYESKDPCIRKLRGNR
jgi:hypothetical protein